MPSKGCHVGIFSILTPEQAKHNKPVNSAPLCHFLDTNDGDVIHYVNALTKMPNAEESNETNWFATPQELVDETQHTPRNDSFTKT